MTDAYKSNLIFVGHNPPLTETHKYSVDEKHVVVSWRGMDFAQIMVFKDKPKPKSYPFDEDEDDDAVLETSADSAKEPDKFVAQFNMPMLKAFIGEADTLLECIGLVKQAEQDFLKFIHEMYALEHPQETP